MNMLCQLQRRIPDARDEALLLDMLLAAREWILAYTCRDELPSALNNAQLELAIVLYNRMGMEGESMHAEGSVKRSAQELPEMILRQLQPYRLARAVEA